MEALASRDYASMGHALASSSAREVHAAMLNACAKGNSGAVQLLLPQASDLSVAQVSGAGSIHGVYCYDFLLLPIASYYFLLLLASPARVPTL